MCVCVCHHRLRANFGSCSCDKYIYSANSRFLNSYDGRTVNMCAVAVVGAFAVAVIIHLTYFPFGIAMKIAHSSTINEFEATGPRNELCARLLHYH